MEAQDTCDLEVSEVLNNPELGVMFRSFAEKHGATAELTLLANMKESLGAEGEAFDTDKVARLPSAEKQQLLRLSNTYLKTSGPPPSVDDKEEVRVMEAAYDVANRKLIGQLLPSFCVSEISRRGSPSSRATGERRPC